MPRLLSTGALLLALAVVLPTLATAQTLHLEGDDGDLQLLVEETSTTEIGRILAVLQNNGGVNLQLVDTSADGGTWQLLTQTPFNQDGFSISLAGTGTREFRIDESGNVYVSGTLVHTSSRTVKENFRDLDPAEVLARVTTLPIASWNYIRDDDTLRHIGPMAEDFHAAFGLGTDDAHIAVSDSVGVALAAIQGLNEVVEAKDAEIAQLRRDNEALENRLTRLEGLVSELDER